MILLLRAKHVDTAAFLKLITLIYVAIVHCWSAFGQVEDIRARLWSPVPPRTTFADLPESARAARELTPRCLYWSAEDIETGYGPAPRANINKQSSARISNKTWTQSVKMLSTNCSC